MKRKFFCAVFFLLSASCFAQETLEIQNKLDKDIMEVYHVLKTDGKTLQGLYQMRYKKIWALAAGSYSNGKKTGIWHFFDYDNKLLENYDYSKSEITYEAPEYKNSYLGYTADKTIKDTDRVTKPIKPGGRLYGYLPYLRLFKKPAALSEVDNEAISVVLELLVSPGGMLADYKIHLKTPYQETVLNVNIDALDAEDRLFVPATYNNEPIASTIFIGCYINNRGKLAYNPPPVN